MMLVGAVFPGTARAFAAGKRIETPGIGFGGVNHGTCGL